MKHSLLSNCPAGVGLSALFLLLSLAAFGWLVRYR